MTTAIVPTVTGWQGGFSNILNRQNGDTVNSYAFPTAAQNGAQKLRVILGARNLGLSTFSMTS